VPIADYLSPQRVCFLSADHKAGVLAELASVLASSGAVRDRDGLMRAILEREKIMSTAIGCGVAIPHAQSDAVRRLVMAVGVHRAGIADYETPDREPVRILVMIASGHRQQRAYIRLLGEVARLLKQEAVRQQLINATTPAQLYEIMVKSEPLGA